MLILINLASKLKKLLSSKKSKCCSLYIDYNGSDLPGIFKKWSTCDLHGHLSNIYYIPSVCASLWEAVNYSNISEKVH